MDLKTDQRGIFIVIEGTDGSGKGTQFNLLAKHLKNAGHQVALFDFPQYTNESSFFVKQYLNGNYGNAEEVGPYTGSLFYALDRYQASKAIQQALDEGKIVLANRFTGSNMAHQGTKFNNPEERRGYYIWLDNLEFMMLKIPRPDLNIVLRVPAEIAQQLVDQKAERDYTNKKRDLHEADLSHLQKSVAVYDELCRLFPHDFLRIDCVRSGSLMTVQDINNLLWETIVPLLPTNQLTPQTMVSQDNHQDNQYVSKDSQGRYSITPSGDDYLSKVLTDTTGDVYAFSENLSPTMIAAAMARLSRRSDDMRITILDEFANSAGKDQQLLQRVITAYGDDSVQQLVGLHLVVENASNLLTKKLEWGRLAAYLEQSTRYIYFDQKNKDGKYRYHVPKHFDESTKNNYIKSLDHIFDNYSKMVRILTDYVRQNSDTPDSQRDIAWNGATRAQACDAIRSVLPVSTQSTVGIYASGQALESLIMHLLSDPLAEARQTGQALLEQARKVVPTFLERADKPERGGATIAYRANTIAQVKQLADDLLSNDYGQYEKPVRLTSVWPRNEIDLVPDMLYEHSHLSLQEITEQVNKWDYSRKARVFNAYMGERLNRRHKPGRAIEKAHYSWDLVCDYGIFRDLQRHRMVDDLEWQQLTPRYGFEVPKLVEDAGLTDLFEECFDISLRLHSALQAAGYSLEAQYATLLGHRMRWKVTYNAREAFHFHELRTSPQGHPGYRKLVQQMHDKLSQVHPIMAEHMRFVNQDENQELNRLAAERYTQYKLKQLD
ncbi:FAD-dependent thymidylate synthase, partial [Candidatus Saccharibacteria bacterium]|nr:FAD-dependent thymidylate synthase [Candidatus Saccharibacteria bacterium]